MQILVDAGADVYTGRTPLHWAANKENCDVVADATVTADDGGVTAWDLMCLAAEEPSRSTIPIWWSEEKKREGGWKKFETF